MYRIRFHGRGGQGMKTAGRILGRTFFIEGYEVQDAPRYGAERRGAPIFAYVRASKQKINERGIIRLPDLVVVADDSLISVPSAGIMEGCHSETVMLIISSEKAQVWQDRLNFKGQIITFNHNPAEHQGQKSHSLGTISAGGAARLLGILPENSLKKAITEELTPLGPSLVESGLETSLNAYNQLDKAKGCVKEGKMTKASDYVRPDWINLPWEEPTLSAPAIHAAATTEKLKTGLWRTLRPVIDHSRCNRCWWLCSTFCPDGAIHLDDQRYPQIDYDHCKGCLICMAQCPPHAIIAEHETEEKTNKAGGQKNES